MTTETKGGYSEDEWRRRILQGKAVCLDCLRPYGDEHGFPDLAITDWAWKKISPTKDEGGLLCPSCICKRLYDAGIRCEGAFMSGPIISISEHSMWLHARLEGIEARLNRLDDPTN